MFIATPEYNNSLPALLKNTIDWVSRNKSGPNGIPYRNKVYGIGSTSDGLIGGARALIDLRRVVLTAVGAILIPEKIEISRAQDAFDEIRRTHRRGAGEAPQVALPPPRRPIAAAGGLGSSPSFI